MIVYTRIPTSTGYIYFKKYTHILVPTCPHVRLECHRIFVHRNSFSGNLKPADVAEMCPKQACNYQGGQHENCGLCCKSLSSVVCAQ